MRYFSSALPLPELLRRLSWRDRRASMLARSPVRDACFSSSMSSDTTGCGFPQAEDPHQQKEQQGREHIAMARRSPPLNTQAAEGEDESAAGGQRGHMGKGGEPTGGRHQPLLSAN